MRETWATSIWDDPEPYALLYGSAHLIKFNNAALALLGDPQFLRVLHGFEEGTEPQDFPDGDVTVGFVGVENGTEGYPLEGNKVMGGPWRGIYSRVIVNSLLGLGRGKRKIAKLRFREGVYYFRESDLQDAPDFVRQNRIKVWS